MLVLPLALDAELPRFEYARSETDATVVTFTRWSPGQKLYVMPTDVYGAPGGAPVARVGGRHAAIGDIGEVATVGGMVNAWYHVPSVGGWVFGASLTPYAYGVDVDGDGMFDGPVTTVSFTADHQIRVRTGDHELVLPTAGGVWLGQVGAGVTAEWIAPDRVGVPLLHLRTGVEACADFAEYWVNIDPARAPTLALEEHGLVDPPNCYTFEPTYAPGKLVMTYTSNGCADDGSRPKKRKKVFRLRDGVFGS